MRLRTAINRYKRGLEGGMFPAECPTHAGAFSGYGDRLVYVDPDGSFRDYSASLSDLHGVDRSRFGIETGDGVRWFDDTTPVRQHYYRDTALVETEYDADEFTVHQYDLTLGRAHITHVELRGEVPTDARLTAFLTFAPEGQDGQVGRLIHDGAGPDGGATVEVFHREEHDYVTASTGLSAVRGQVPERFDELLAPEPVDFPREVPLENYEDTHLSSDIVVSAPLERAGRGMRTTLVTQLSDHTETTREQALADVRGSAEMHATPDALRTAARERVAVETPEGTPREGTVTDDLRALSLLTAPTGGRIAGPDFDPYYAYSGGYGYTWFRDDAEISGYLLSAADRLDLDLGDTLERSARFHCDAQLEDGTWPHRAWAVDGSLAPGWAHARVENRDVPEYQADQTASVVTFLAELLRERGDDLDESLRSRVRETVRQGVEGLDATLDEDGLPERCQNLWEDTDGRFTHTAATFLEAYATVSRTPVGGEVRKHATVRAQEVMEGLDALWEGSAGHYGLRLDGDDLDDRLDSGTFALVSAFVEYDRALGLSEDALDRLVSHVETALDGLYRETDDVQGLVRYEGDPWRRRWQDEEKVWSVSTVWGADAATRLAALLDRRDRTDESESLLEWAGHLYEVLSPDGPLCTDAGFLTEQVFDDGTPDSAAPLGWSHALRLHTTALLAELDALPAVATPSGPESRPRWTTAEKYGVGTVADHDDSDPSKVWFTLTDGALTEVRFPRIDVMNLRTLDFLVVDTDEDESYTARTFTEDRRDERTGTLERRAEHVGESSLRFRQTVTETGDGRGHEWRLTAEYVADPDHDAIVADVSFEALDDAEYAVYAVADTALTNTGDHDIGYRLGEAGAYHLVARDAGAFDAEGDPLLVDGDGDPYSVATALVAEDRFDWATVEVGGSGRLGRLFGEGVLDGGAAEATDENVVLVGRLGTGGGYDGTVALGFAEDADTAGALGEAEGSLARGYETVRAGYDDSWRAYLSDKPLPDSVADDRELAEQYRVALMSLAAVEDKTYHGAAIASPSVPWGEAVIADEPKGYGYNFVWSRDLYQTFTVLDAVGDVETAHDALAYVYRYQQDEDGFIPQNTYLSGRTRWGGEQMDNIAFPGVMAYHLYERGVGFANADYDYANLRRSSDYIARHGPATQQERWEEESGYSPSSIAAEIAGLTCAAKVAIEEDEPGDALAWLALADDWQSRVEVWTATDNGTDRITEIPYYVRVTRDGDPNAGHYRTLANGGPTLDEREIIDAGFLELVRLGVKPWDDETIRNSVEVVDETIRVETPHGPAFYRYNGDGYGELDRDEEGAPWAIDGGGRGRLWPIFTGERAEYELLAGGQGADDPESLLRTMAGFANSGRMLAEQVWDRDRETSYNWEFGEGTGSATPLGWSMAQFVRLAHGIDAGEPVERPAFVAERYATGEAREGPSLVVDTEFEGDRVRVSGETDGALVAVKTPTETVAVDPEDGQFETRVGIQHGENRIVVAAATEADLERAGTTVERLAL
ncbi:glycoside hydrolase family 15 protein [Salinirubellus sp. GCM10025818]|uniref:glycoside hydrolase family 15 protein n=1 Tax=Salinirubellus TaxID=2162630 RepID=UPI0030D227C6